MNKRLAASEVKGKRLSVIDGTGFGHKSEDIVLTEFFRSIRAEALGTMRARRVALSSQNESQSHLRVPLLAAMSS